MQPHVIEALLNLVSGHRAGLTSVYQRHHYIEEKREALVARGIYVVGLVDPSPKPLESHLLHASRIRELGWT